MIEVLYALGTVFGLYDVAEGSARLVAALLLFLHPPHEQSLGFRRAFNAKVRGYKTWQAYNLDSFPLSRHMNRLQALALATAFPALALFGPWWALAGIVSFYLADTVWTHRWMKVPGLSSAFAATVAVFCAGVLARPETVNRWEQSAGTASLLAGLLLLAFPWIMAYRRVRNA